MTNVWVIMIKDGMKINLSLQLKECENLDRDFYTPVTHKAVGSGIVLPNHFSTGLIWGSLWDLLEGRNCSAVLLCLFLDNCCCLERRGFEMSHNRAAPTSPLLPQEQQSINQNGQAGRGEHLYGTDHCICCWLCCWVLMNLSFHVCV